MSDTSLTIELNANTSAAVSEVGKLKTELRETTTAATVAQSAQKQLGLDVGRTSSQVAEAKQALANLTAASRNVELTTAAYGKESRQAAEAVAKQAAAQREATKAAAAAAAATTRLLADTRAVAVAQDGQMSPALKRAATNAIRFGENVERITDDLHRMELAAVATARATEDKLAKATARASADLASLHGSTSKVSTGMIALGTAGGNLLASGAQRAVHGIGEAMSFTLRSAIDMESGMKAGPEPAPGAGERERPAQGLPCGRLLGGTGDAHDAPPRSTWTMTRLRGRSSSLTSLRETSVATAASNRVRRSLTAARPQLRKWARRLRRSVGPFVFK